MFLSLPPHRALSPLVHAYWFVEDRVGAFAGWPVRTGPLPAAVLSVNIGRPNATDEGTLVPRVSLLGVQTRARSWRSWPDTYFVMAMLTAAGLVRFFPHTGECAAGALVDLGAIAGDGPGRALADAVGAAMEPVRVADALDRWLMRRLEDTAPAGDGARLGAACRVLRDAGSVREAADAAAWERRQLHRCFRRHLGIGPKAFADLERLQGSVRAVQRARGDGATGYADQAHQIRSWRRRLGVTPGAYRRAGGSPMAASFGADPAAPAFYL